MKIVRMKVLKRNFVVTAHFSNPMGLWSVSDDGFIFRHFLQFGSVVGENVIGVQLVIGPLLITWAWAKK